MDLKPLLHPQLPQSHLGSSASGHIIVVESVERVSRRITTKKRHLLDLPDEIVYLIFLIVAYTGDTERFFINTLGAYGALSLALTCKRFHSIAIPLLYRLPSFLFSKGYVRMVPPEPRAVQLFRAFESQPFLQRSCKQLCIGISERYSILGAFRFARARLPLLTNLTSLRIYGGFRHLDTWSTILHAADYMPMLEELEMQGLLGWGPSLPQIYETMDIPRLRVLRLHSCYDRHPAPHGSISTWQPGSVDSEKERTGTVTRLYITEPSNSPESLQHFLSWPRKLEHFVLDSLERSERSSDDYRLQHIATGLWQHRQSLKSLGLGRFRMDFDRYYPDFTAFERLDKLRIYGNNMQLKPKQFAKGLLAPRLATLIFDYGDNCPPLVEQHLKWYRRFFSQVLLQECSLRSVVLAGPLSFSHGVDSFAIREFWKLQYKLHAAGISLSLDGELIEGGGSGGAYVERGELDWADYLEKMVWDVPF